MSADDFMPQTALDEAAHVTDRVRSAARWHGWMWLTGAMLTPVFLYGTLGEGLPHAWQLWYAVIFGAVGAALTIWEVRRGVIGRQAARVDRWATLAYVITVLGATVLIGLTNPGGAAWSVPVALAPSVPCLVAAWRVLRG